MEAWVQMLIVAMLPRVYICGSNLCDLGIIIFIPARDTLRTVLPRINTYLT
jgi:hypothetical protein